MGNQRIKTFQDLVVWQKAYALTLKTYRCTRTFPRDEVFGLTSQLRRAASSVSANIVEGFARGTKEFLQFLVIARGSLEETKFHLLLAKDLEYLHVETYQEFQRLTDEVGRMLNALIVSLRKRMEK